MNRVDERDLIFSRASYEKNSPAYNDYYEKIQIKKL